jgi:hypothetical protein
LSPKDCFTGDFFELLEDLTRKALDNRHQRALNIDNKQLTSPMHRPTTCAHGLQISQISAPPYLYCVDNRLGTLLEKNFSLTKKNFWDFYPRAFNMIRFYVSDIAR